MVDRDKVISGLNCCARTDGANCIYCPYNNKDEDCTALMSMDVLALLKEWPDVVRCKDCKWYDPRCALCDNCGLPREPSFFCADGRRMTKAYGR